LLRLPLIARYAPGVWAWDQLGRLGAALVLMSIPLLLMGSHPPVLRQLTLVLGATVVYAGSLVVLKVDPVPALLARARLGRFGAAVRPGSRPSPPTECLTELVAKVPVAVED